MELKMPLFCKASTYSVLEKAVAEGKLTDTKRAAYCFVEDTQKFYRVDPDKTIKPIIGDNAAQIERVEQLPSVSAGNMASLYILGNTVYTFDGEAYYPTYQDVSAAIEALTETVSSFDADITNLKSSVSDLSDVVSSKADADSVYSKVEVDSKLDGKANVTDVYSKTEADDLLALKANAADVYSKNETDVLLDAKADANTVYTKTEVDDMMGGIVDPSTGETVTVQEYVDTAKAEAQEYTDNALALILV